MPTRCWIEVPLDQIVDGVPLECGTPYSFPPAGGSIAFSFTDASFTRVLSALINGAALAYPDDWLQVVWDFLVNVECPVSICEQIIECINSNEGTRLALSNWIREDPNAASAIQSLINNGTLLVGGASLAKTDDLAALFGAATYLTDMINEAISDFYQRYEILTNDRERGELLFNAIPLIETLPVDEMSEYISDLEEDIAENYAAQWTTTPVTGSRDRIRCAIFCAAQANGNEITWEIVEDYFWGRVGFTPSNLANVVIEFAAFLITGQWQGQEIVDISFGNFAAAMRNSQIFDGLKFPSMATTTKLGQNDPDPDYVFLCECADPICVDFAASQNGWEVWDEYCSPTPCPWGRYVAGEGYKFLPPPAQWQNFLYIVKDGGYNSPMINLTIKLGAPLTANRTFSFGVFGQGAQTLSMFVGEQEKTFPVSVPANERLALSTNGYDADLTIRELCFLFEQ